MIARGLLTTENIGRGILIWPAAGSPWQGTLKAWTSDYEELFVVLEKDYGHKKGQRKGDLLAVKRDVCSFNQSAPVHACGDPDCIVPHPAPHKRQPPSASSERSGRQ